MIILHAFTCKVAIAVEAVELSQAWEVLIDGELLGFSVLALVGKLDELVIDGIVGLQEELAPTCRGSVPLYVPP